MLSRQDIDLARRVVERCKEDHFPAVDWPELHRTCGRLEAAISHSGFGDANVTLHVRHIDETCSAIRVDIQANDEWASNITSQVELSVSEDGDTPFELQLVAEVRRKSQAWADFADTLEAILSPTATAADRQAVHA